MIMSEEIINPSLNYIRGYRDVDDARERDYAYEYESYDTFIFNLLSIVQDLVSNLYPHAEDDIREEIEELPTMKWGPDIRYTIYKIFRAIAATYNLPISQELSIIRYAHYGREMREPLFNALMKIGANQSFYYKAKSEDFVYTTTSDGAFLIRYIGPHKGKIEIPESVIDPNDSENLISVTSMSISLFSNARWITAIKVPNTINAIY